MPNHPRPPVPQPYPTSPTVTTLLQWSKLASPKERVLASFLGSVDAAGSVRVGRLRAGLLWDCLAGYLAAGGWATLGQLGFDHDGHDEAVVMDLVEFGPGEWVEVPTNGFLFAERGGERVVFSARRETTGERPSFAITIRAAEPHRLLREWEEFTSGHNRLAGRSILPDGRLVGGERRYDWSDVFLDAETEKTVRFHVQRLLASTADALRRLGVRQRGGLILAGAPGTGKTLIGKVLASVVERSFIWVTPAHLADARGVSELFGLARLLAPVVLFVEDLDVLAEERGRNGGNVILGEIMNQLDGCHPQ